MAEQLYRVRFVNEDKVYELYAEYVYQGEMYGFITVEGIVFNESDSVLVDPSEEKLKIEFEGVNQTYVPMHAVIRIDEVKKRGTAKIIETGDGKVTQFPSGLYAPNKSGADKKD